MQPGTEPNLAGVAAHLMAAWESGDRARLATAVHDAAGQLGGAAGGSLHWSEVRELLQGVVQGLEGLLGAARARDFRREPQAQIYHNLLRHAQESASAAACPAFRTGAAV